MGEPPREHGMQPAEGGPANGEPPREHGMQPAEGGAPENEEPPDEQPATESPDEQDDVPP
ncbi:hypothetical protein [Saccharopolyspora sp. CA-218241]|uniref:hypothetical protein n=1 Tax=Saccharopolyspora sp. CA-218241 TaxID=3240027 RepID=UPI003D97195F